MFCHCLCLLLSGSSVLLPRNRDMQLAAGDSTLPIGVNGCLSLCAGPVIDW